MDILVKDTNFNNVAVIDTYKSLIWTDRYNQCGDFELHLPVRQEFLESLKEDNYLQIKDSEHAMIVQDISVDSDAEEGNSLTITGKSLETILERRIVWGQKIITGNLQDGLETLFNEAIISPTIPERKIDNFIFLKSDDPRITELTIDAEYTGDDLYTIVTNICVEHNIGFKLVLNDDNRFVFSLYSGEDRSYNQTENPYVVFSPKFENIINSNYYTSKANYRNVTLVAGEGDEYRYRQTVVVGSASGLDRREIFTDASSVQQDSEEATLSNAEYLSVLETEGSKTLNDHKISSAFEGEVETTQTYKFGKDYFVGDTVQIANEYGHEGTAYISELIISHSETGVSIYPTFTKVEEKEDES